MRLVGASLAAGGICSAVALGVLLLATIATGEAASAWLPATATSTAPESPSATVASAVAVPETSEVHVSSAQDEQSTLPADAMLVVAAPPSDSPPGVQASAVVAAESLVENPTLAASLVDLINNARTREGLPALEVDRSLAVVAHARAEDLVGNGYFDHYSPAGESAFSELALRGIRYRLAGENLARNTYPETRTVQAAFDGLMASPTHRANILEPRFARIAVSAVRSGKTWLYVTVFVDGR